MQLHYLNQDELFLDIPDENGNFLTEFTIDARSAQLRLGLDLYVVSSKTFAWKFIVGPTLGYLRFPIWQGTYGLGLNTDGSPFVRTSNLRDTGFDTVVFGIEAEAQLLFGVGRWKFGPTISLAGSSGESGFQSYGFWISRAF